MAIKQWIYRPCDREAAADISETCGCSKFCALLLAARGMTDYSEIDEFLSNDIFFSDPFSIDGMATAAELIRAEIEKGGRICVFGDYDADGVTATALLSDCFARLRADVIWRVPLRENGYGIRAEDVDELKEQGVSMIVTVDNGICAFAAAERAKELDIALIVTDHHLPQQTLPDACAVIDPHIEGSAAEFKDYAGVGVAFMLACAVCEADPVELVPRYGDIVAIGTVADVVPLLHDNRAFVRYGAEMISGFPSCGVSALLDAAGLAGKTVDSRAIAFGLAPRINAAGRIFDASDAVRLLKSEDEYFCAEAAARLDNFNTMRKQYETEISDCALEMIENDEKIRNMPVLIVKSDNWHPGVLGIAAAKLCERFSKPCIVFTERDGELCGSARSFKGVSVFDILSGASEYLYKFGGHELAAGVTVLEKDFEKAKAAICESALNLYPTMPLPLMEVTLKLNPAALNIAAVYSTRPLEPFGCANEAPIYLLERMMIERIDAVGKTGGHTRLTLSRGNARVTAMYFYKPEHELYFAVGDTVDVAVSLDINHYNNTEKLTVIVQDIHFSGMSYSNLGIDLRSYELWKLCGEKNEYAKELQIKRNDVQIVWRNIKTRKRLTGSEDIIQKRIGLQRFLKTRLILDILSELEMIKLSSGETLEVEFIENPVKNPLENSPTYKNFAAEE